MHNAIRGYAEGYYGRLPEWTERLKILDSLHLHGMNTYYYAPKEDPCHRRVWRQPYDRQWRDGFSNFCRYAKLRQVKVIAGVAPGIDFDYRHLHDGPDFKTLVQKCCMLLNHGANGISLLMDDIDADFHTRDAGIESEGIAHGLLANALAKALHQEMRDVTGQAVSIGEGLSLWVTPRIYADELAAAEPYYLPDFLAELDLRHYVLYCG
ncbi:MAG: beta-N-acetylglucosaminidase domain-containing protein, partial [Granulosicoccus sp.]